MELEKAIKNVEEIAKNGTQEEKKAFVLWACEGVIFLSAQLANGCGGEKAREALNAIKAQYNAYLKALNG